MADDASVSIQATILPDEIAKTLTGSMTVTPADANDKWYYKLTACTATSTDLIIVDDGAGGTNRKAALSRVVTLMTAQGFVTDDPTALAIALG